MTLVMELLRYNPRLRCVLYTPPTRSSSRAARRLSLPRPELENAGRQAESYTRTSLTNDPFISIYIDQLDSLRKFKAYVPEPFRRRSRVRSGPMPLWNSCFPSYPSVCSRFFLSSRWGLTRRHIGCSIIFRESWIKFMLLIY